MSSEAVKQGWLNKKGGGKRRANWTRRFFVLHKDKLDYFTDDKLTCLKGSVPIDGTLLTFNVVPFSEKKCAFVMALPNRDFVMQAATDVEMNGWIRILLQTYMTRRTEIEQEEEDKKKELEKKKLSRTESVKCDPGSMKMMEAQFKFDELFKFDNTRVRKEGILKKVSDKDQGSKPLSHNKRRSVYETKSSEYLNKHGVLTLCELTLYDSSEKKNIVGNINLKAVQDVVAIPENPKVILLLCPLQTYTITTGCDRERDEWMEEIKTCLATLAEKQEETKTNPLANSSPTASPIPTPPPSPSPLVPPSSLLPFPSSVGSDAKKWGVQEVAIWMKSFPYFECKNIDKLFEENQICGIDLFELTEEEIEVDLDLKMGKDGPGTIVWKVVGWLVRKEETSSTTSPSSSPSTPQSSSEPASSPLPSSPPSFSPLLLPPTKSSLPPSASSPSLLNKSSPPPFSLSPPSSPSSPSSPPQKSPNNTSPGNSPNCSSPMRSSSPKGGSPISNSLKGGSPKSGSGGPKRAGSLIRAGGRLMDGEGLPPQRRLSVPKTYSFSSIPVAQWSVKQVGEWLTAIGAKTAVAPFAENKVNGADLFDLSGEDIRVEIEIEDIRIESAILKGIGLLKKGNLVPTKLFVEKNETVDEPCGESEELPEGWKEYVDPKGRKYYYNKQTRQKQWNKPAVASNAITKQTKGPLFLWGSAEVVTFLEDSNFTSEFIDSVKKAGWNGQKLAGATRNDVVEVGGEAVFEKFATEMCNLLAKNGQKFVVLWSFEANHDSKLTLTAGKTVYGVESVDEEWIKVRDQKGGVGRVPFRYLRLVDRIEKSPTKTGRPTRSLSRARRSTQSISIKEKIKPHEWEGKDVEQWLKDIEIGEEVIKLLEGVTGKELLQLTPEAFKQRGITQQLALTSLEKGIKQLLTGNVPRTARQVKHYSHWNSKDVVGWLVEIGLGPMTQQATEQGLKGEDLGRLDKERVKELGGEESSWVNIEKKLAKLDIEWGVKEE